MVTIIGSITGPVARSLRGFASHLFFAGIALEVLILACSAYSDSPCSSNVKVVFSPDGETVTVTADKDLSNVVLGLCASADTLRFEGLTGRVFTYTSASEALSGAWVKAGCAKSGDGPGFGVFVASPFCTSPLPTAAPTPPGNPNIVSICHIPDQSSETWRTLIIKESDLALHLGHGDSLGPCPVDCMGIPMGKAVLDSCGVCGGDNTTCKDCNGVVNGGAILDICGVCGGDGKSCPGCDGVPNSGKVIDACGLCGGDSSSCKDCNGVPGGGAKVDACGVCGGNNSTCKDCAGTVNGLLRPDACGVCGGSNVPPCSSTLNCDGVIDKCGVCNGSDACLDCAGIPNGGTKIDCCGVCGGDGNSCLDKCKFYELDAAKRQTSQSLKILHASVKKYSLGEIKCSKGRNPEARKRLRLAAELVKENTALLKSLGKGTLKLCNTPFCAKTSLASPLSALKRNTARLYGLSRESQYAARRACSAPTITSSAGGSGPSRSNGAFNNANGALGALPNQKCD